MHQQPMFSLFQVTVHSYNRLPPIHPEYSSVSCPPHRPSTPISIRCVLCFSGKLVGCVSVGMTVGIVKVVRQGILNLSLLSVSAVEFSFSGYVPTEHKPSSGPKFQHKQIFRQHPTDQFILTSSLWKPNSL